MTTFEPPKKGDLDHALSSLMHESRRQLQNEINAIKGEAIQHGALQSNRVVVVAVDAANRQHEAAIEKAKDIIFDFLDRLGLPPSELVGWARPHLENLGNSLLGCIPPNGFPNDHVRLVKQHRAVFEQRLSGALRHIEIGFAGQPGFRGETTQQEWIAAKDAVDLLRPVLSAASAQMTICARAHAGIVHAKAATYLRDSRKDKDFDIPSEFWWAEGHEALTQNWDAGDFETWLEHRVRLRAFGVRFLRTDIEAIAPKKTAHEDSPAVSQSARASAVILTALHAESKAVLRHLSNCEQRTVAGGTVFFVGDFWKWKVAVAECGEGNATAASIIERAVHEFKPGVALFVGVAGGIKDVTIGDVIVSTKVYGYERGRDTDSGFKPRPDVFVANHAIEQQARALRHANRWHQRLDPELPHSSPQLFVGPIAAGEKVVTSTRSETAKLLRENYSDVLGIEMEGAGFLNGVHLNSPLQGAVIRGISDLLDGKADADKAGSQQRAADAASSVAFEILSSLAASRGQ